MNLKPCPFCRSKNLSFDSTGCIEIKGSTHQKCWIVCEDCGAEGPAVDIVDGINADSVSAAWNRRASPKPLTDEQIREITNKTIENITVSEAVLFRSVAREIEAAHGIKEAGNE